MSLFHPRVDRYLVSQQGEQIIDKVRKHWAALLVPWTEVGLGSIVLIAANTTRGFLAFLLLVMGSIAFCHGLWRVLAECRDVFVITNMRVFRVHGILSQQIATMPLTRILDVSVYKPFIGRLLGYGNFVFESAAQAQGLREIRFVGRPDDRGLTIQKVITEAGLRGMVMPGMGMTGMGSTDIGAGTNASEVPLVPTRPPGLEADQRQLAWLLTALRHEHERLEGLGLETPPRPPLPVRRPRDPDATDTAPIDLPR